MCDCTYIHRLAAECISAATQFEDATAVSHPTFVRCSGKMLLSGPQCHYQRLIGRTAVTQEVENPHWVPVVPAWPTYQTLAPDSSAAKWTA